MMLYLHSVKFIEGTVTSLEEEDGCVTGIQYRGKDSGITKVTAHGYTEILQKESKNLILRLLF